MTPDSLVAALRAVPCRTCGVCHYGKPSPGGTGFLEHSFQSDYPALAAKAREWIKGQMPGPAAYVPFYARSWQNGFDSAVAEVARRLGLS